MSMKDVDDGYIRGWLEGHAKICANCGVETTVVRLEVVNLPEGIKAKDNRIILNRCARVAQSHKVGPFLGIGCGCYARAHRQLAHVSDRIAAGAE